MVRRSDDGNRYGQHRGYEHFIERHFVLSLGVTFIVTLGVFMGLLYLSACIPKEEIRENLLESVYYLEENEDEFYHRRDNNRRTLIDNYADTIEFNIMYSVEEEHRLESMLISPFYYFSILLNTSNISSFVASNSENALALPAATPILKAYS